MRCAPSLRPNIRCGSDGQQTCFASGLLVQVLLGLKAFSPEDTAMIKSILIALGLVTVLLLCFTSRASAQSSPYCVAYVQYCPTCGDVPLPGMNSCTSEGPFLDVCEIPNNQCAPAAGPQETACICATCSTGKAGDPISLASGDTYIRETDIRLSGLGGGLTLQRTWNSLWPSTESAFQTGMFGPNWRSTYEEEVFLGSDNYMKYGRSDGSFWSFGYNGSGWSTVAPGNVSATLTQGTSYWTITFHDGEKRLFDNVSGKLIAIIDRNGNTTTLTYDDLGRLTTVTGPASRHLYFSYGTGSGSLVTSVTSDVGLSLSYSYDAQGRLTQYTKTDGTTVSFQYDSNSLISSVTDQDGKVLESHTYDSSGRGLTSSRANGVDAVTLSY